MARLKVKQFVQDDRVAISWDVKMNVQRSDEILIDENILDV